MNLKELFSNAIAARFEQNAVVGKTPRKYPFSLSYERNMRGRTYKAKPEGKPRRTREERRKAAFLSMLSKGIVPQASLEGDSLSCGNLKKIPLQWLYESPFRVVNTGTQRIVVEETSNA